MENILNSVELAIKTHNSKLMKTLSLDIENELLEESVFPEWCFDLVIKLFKDDKFCAAPGSEHFIWILYNDFEKLSISQSEFLFKLFTAEYDRFKNKNLLHSIADFVARKFPPALTLKAFQDAFNQGNDASRYAALVGSEILAVNKNASDNEKSIAANLISQITARDG